MFIDKVRLKFEGGDGGAGAKDFDFNKRPAGGDGGYGGNVVIKGSNHLKDLGGFTVGPRKYKAEQGKAGGKNKLTGARGADLIIEVPIGTSIYDEETKDLLGEVISESSSVIIAKGGKGGLGNSHFKGGFSFERERTIPARSGQVVNTVLEQRLKAEIVFIGFPNAGKSSMLNALANTNVKVASYAFTTLEPNLGRVDGITLMDLPGLIEGTVEGKGLGTRFTKHAEQAKIIAHFISLENNDILDIYNKMRKELESISEILYALPEIIILTKSDLFDEKIISAKLNELKNISSEIIVCSAFQKETVIAVKEKFKVLVSN